MFGRGSGRFYHVQIEIQIPTETYLGQIQRLMVHAGIQASAVLRAITQGLPRGCGGAPQLAFVKRWPAEGTWRSPVGVVGLLSLPFSG